MTQSNGTAAMSVVSRVVTPSMRLDGANAKAIHISRWRVSTAAKSHVGAEEAAMPLPLPFRIKPTPQVPISRIRAT